MNDKKKISPTPWEIVFDNAAEEYRLKDADGNYIDAGCTITLAWEQIVNAVNSPDGFKDEIRKANREYKEENTNLETEVRNAYDIIEGLISVIDETIETLKGRHPADVTAREAALNYLEARYYRVDEANEIIKPKDES